MLMIDDCSRYNLTSGCELYDSDIIFGHFKSLGARELVLEFLLKLNFRKGLGDLGDGISVTYVGDEVLEQEYDVTITGVPPGTVLNPIQRDYLEKVTFDFLEEFSTAEPHRVEIRQSVSDQRLLRRRETRHVHSSFTRDLEEQGVVHAEAVVFGIGKDREAFLEELEKAFVSNTEQYKEEVQRQQYLPGEINDETNLGVVFEGLTDITVKRFGPPSPPTPTVSSSKEKLNSSQIQIIVFSVGLVVSFLWLVYRILKDCVWVEDGWTVKKEKLSEKVEREKGDAVSRPELSNMDKPRQRPSMAIDITGLRKLKLPKDDATVTTKDSSARRGRNAPTSRGVRSARSSDDLDLLRPKTRNTSDHRREPTRGVGRAKSSDIDLFSESYCRNIPTSARSQGEARRVVGRAKSSDDADIFGVERVTKGSSSHDRSVASSRGVGRSKSSDSMNLVGGPRPVHSGSAPSHKGRPASGSSVATNKNTSSGIEGSKGGGSPRKPTKKKKSDGKDAKTHSSLSPKSTKTRSKKVTTNGTSISEEKLKKKKKKTSSDNKEKKAKKKTKTSLPKRSAAAPIV